LWKVVDAVDEVLNRIEQQKEEPELPEGIRALELLQLAYRGKIKLTPLQVRCAEAALPCETPKLSATAVTTMDGKSFAEALDRAIARSNGPPLLNGPVEQLPAEDMKAPFTRLRRF
jgi:hypothetical protein